MFSQTFSVIWSEKSGVRVKILAESRPGDTERNCLVWEETGGATRSRIPQNCSHAIVGLYATERVSKWKWSNRLTENRTIQFVVKCRSVRTWDRVAQWIDLYISSVHPWKCKTFLIEIAPSGHSVYLSVPSGLWPGHSGDSFGNCVTVRVGNLCTSCWESKGKYQASISGPVNWFRSGAFGEHWSMDVS